jgi:outer membrane protein insertion porin family
VSQFASLAIQQQEGTNLNSLISNEFIYDRRDNRNDPASGYYIRYRNDISTVPGTLGYMGNRLGGGYYTPFDKSESIIGSISGEIGYLFDMPKPIPIIDSYQLGGTSFRGFATQGIGPRDLATADSLGGKEYAVGTVQVSFPMGLPDEYQVRGHVFSDFGTMYGTDANEGIVQDCTCFRASVGFGVIWKSPFGPLAVDFAIPVAKASFDQTQVINFNVGTNF